MASIRSRFLFDASCAIVMFDLANEATFRRVPLFVTELRTRRPTISISLVASKLDLLSERQVDFKAAHQCALQLDLADYMEVSAVFGENVLLCVRSMVIETLFQHVFGCSVCPLPRSGCEHGFT
jgi:hypothetical protein